jgi:hypothetical protein
MIASINSDNNQIHARIVIPQTRSSTAFGSWLFTGEECLRCQQFRP